jgi:DNA-binding transcriptional ArsR family regulator
MVEKFIELNLNDERAGKVAEILSNKTAKKILSIIAEKELTESDIAKELQMPLNTIDYNIKKLLEAGLIEKSKNFFWSVKGRKIETYKLANKKIIISTKPRFSGLISSVLIFGAIGFATSVFSNIFSASKKIYSSGILNVPQADMIEILSSKSTDLISNAPMAGETASAALSNTIFNFSSLFYNSIPWIIFGVLVGILIFFIYKKSKLLKGGQI